MKSYLSSFLTTFSYPEESRAPLLDGLDKLLASPMRETFLSFLDAYEKDTHIRYNDIFKKMDEVSLSAEIHPYTGVFLLLALWTKRAREVWREKGYSDELFHNTFLDLRYKIIECKLVKGVWGTFVADWYPRFFTAKIFALGRLQFEMIPLGKCAKVGELTLDEKSPVLSMHIPRNGESMSPDKIEESFRMAKAFFRERFEKEGAPLLFHCHS